MGKVIAKNNHFDLKTLATSGVFVLNIILEFALKFEEIELSLF